MQVVGRAKEKRGWSQKQTGVEREMRFQAQVPTPTQRLLSIQEAGKKEVFSDVQVLNRTCFPPK